MAGSFLSTASKKVTDVRAFLRDAAGGSSIKYAAEKGAKHMIYIPYVSVPVRDEQGNETIEKQLIAISGNVHEWQSPDGKYKATVCMKDVIRKDDNDNILNDGTCPFCDRVGDAWDIYRYRKELEEATCKLSGEDRKKHLEKTGGTFADERKAKDARSYMYILIAKYRNGEGNSIVLDKDNIPEYDLKVMKLSNSRVEKLQQQIANAGSALPGSELMLEYPNTDDRRLQVSQSTTAPVFPNNMLTIKYPTLLDKITKDVEKFEWSGIEKSFPEWSGMTVHEATNITDALFEKWDQYKKELAINPTTKYLEYVTETPVTQPSIGVPTGPSAAIPSIPTVPNVAAPSVPGGQPSVPPVPDINSVFGGTAAPGAAPSIQI